MMNIENKVLLYVFAVDTISREMVMLMKTQMKHLKMKVGLLANFHGERLKVERV